MRTTITEQSQTAELAQVSVSETISESDVKRPSVFEVPVQAEKREVATENANTRLSNEAYEGKKAKNSISRKMLKNNLVSPMPQAASGANLVLYIILAVLLPPLAVGLLYGIGIEFLISILLTLLFWVPGIIYALILVLNKA